jgi:hypothetical protein
MRLWSLHPCYLDAKGLVALWREGLLARQVLLAQTKGYRHHPQLERFKETHDPAAAIEDYLFAVYEEASNRGYHFDRGKIADCPSSVTLIVTDGQLWYELQHLKQKLKVRDVAQYKNLADLDLPQPHPIFNIVSGDVALWEKIR